MGQAYVHLWHSLPFSIVIWIEPATPCAVHTYTPLSSSRVLLSSSVPGFMQMQDKVTSLKFTNWKIRERDYVAEK